MNKDEILVDMISKGIVVSIGDSYILTEKYKELLLLEQSQKITLSTDISHTPKALNYDKLLNVGTSGNDWPESIRDVTGRSRCTAIMDMCQIPSMVHSATGPYRVRGITADAVNVISNIVDDVDIVPGVFISAIQVYYKNMERPKSFKNLVLSGEVLDIYQEHLSGTFLKSFQNPQQDSTQKWG
jgi:hypothetical protein